MNAFIGNWLPDTFLGRIAVATPLAFAVVTLDVVSGRDIRAYPLYFIPLVVASLKASRYGAIIVASLCTALWAISKLLDGTQFQSPWIWLANIALQEAAFTFVALLVCDLGAAMTRQASTAKILAEQHQELIRRKLELERLNSDLSSAIRSREDAERISRHDLKTPLASIAATPALLRKGRNLNSEDVRLLRMIESAANRALGMVNLSLNLQQMESGQYVFKPATIDLTQIVLAVIDDLTKHAESKSVSIRLSGEAPHLFAAAESLLCYSIISNLLKNAIEAAPEQSEVRVELIDGPQMRLSIHNMGAVPRVLRDRFFSKYATHGKAGGSGLGAYSAQLMARAQEGSLTLESSEESGTTLTLVLNRATESPVKATAEATSMPEADRRICAQRVLIVDDEPYNQLVLTKMLPSPPVEIDTAINGRLALVSAMSRRPDVIFMDIEMPVMGGIEALKGIREFQAKSEQRPSLIVAFSANDDQDSCARYLANGFDGCLSKPCSPRDVLAMLRTEGICETPEQARTAAVFVDRDLLPEIPSFLETRKGLLSQLQAAIQTADHEAVRRLAHKLAGSFAVFGFEWAAATCKEIEKSPGADPSALVSIKLKVEALAQHLDAVEVRPLN